MVKQDKCKLEIHDTDLTDSFIPVVVEKLSNMSFDEERDRYSSNTALPSKEKIISLIRLIRDILFPGYFGNQDLSKTNINYHLGEELNELYRKLSEEITRCIRHDCIRNDLACTDCVKRGREECRNFIENLPGLRQKLVKDVRAAQDGDPAAKSEDEVIFSYPGFYAILVYRAANIFYRSGIPLLPRILTEYAHSVTGIDIHPGAQIAESFFIDHGTGVVIGETTDIGNHVRIYQGVTLGALSIRKDEKGDFDQITKRHPTLEDGVIVYSNATILGGETVIGERSVVGGNVWLTESVPAKSIVFSEHRIKRIQKK